MPWAKRADGTWGNVVVEAPVILPASDSEDEEDTQHIKSIGPQSNLVAARAAQFHAAQTQIQKASPARATVPSISKKKPPPPPGERTPPAPPPYAPAFPPRRTTATLSHDNDDAEPATELDKVARFEPKPIRPRVISNSTSLPALRRRPPPPPAAPVALSTEEHLEEDTVDEELTGTGRLPPPIPRITSPPSLVHSQSLPVDLRPPLPSRQPSQSTPPLPSRRPQAAPPLPSRQSSQSTSASAPPLPSRKPQSTPPLPPRSTPSAPPLPSRSTSRSTSPLVDEEEPISRTPASSSRNPNLRPPPTRTKTSSIDRAATGPSWSSDKTGFAKGKAVEMARNRRDCLNPPPVCFSRDPPAPTGEGEKGIQITYAPLPAPIILRSPNSNDLAKAITTGRAFPSKPPPLLSHDVQREDWNKLWDDIDETARIEMRASAGLSVATLPLMPIFGAGFAVSTIAERKLRAGRVGPTCKLVEAWNVNFFRPRHLDVYIAQNSSRLSGPTPTPASRQTIDPAFLKWQQASGAEKQLAMKEYEKYEGKFRFVVQSWPLEG
ncbi:hypothetical protein B0H14DRAFT_2926075 [Mycena olivaceomarginata]|nr:hypothetical protein B0H14DRAFT_2926075 [Mycena olivaceomarginata]